MKRARNAQLKICLLLKLHEIEILTLQSKAKRLLCFLFLQLIDSSNKLCILIEIFFAIVRKQRVSNVNQKLRKQELRHEIFRKC